MPAAWRPPGTRPCTGGSRARWACKRRTRQSTPGCSWRRSGAYMRGLCPRPRRSRRSPTLRALRAARAAWWKLAQARDYGPSCYARGACVWLRSTWRRRPARGPARRRPTGSTRSPTPTARAGQPRRRSRRSRPAAWLTSRRILTRCCFCAGHRARPTRPRPSTCAGWRPTQSRRTPARRSHSSSIRHGPCQSATAKPCRLLAPRRSMRCARAALGSRAGCSCRRGQPFPRSCSSGLARHPCPASSVSATRPPARLDRLTTQRLRPAPTRPWPWPRACAPRWWRAPRASLTSCCLRYSSAPAALSRAVNG
ncbi:hypothetical protein T492DRAFT_968644 [Pavlovales sp. CCMP2436]|nr:hypothetical protein T492DRAFT_968644 [Pavlovales sp. CCMP2436]